MSDDLIADEVAAALDIEAEADNVIELRDRIRAENIDMSAQLAIIGQGPTPLLYMSTRLETLIDFLMNTNEDALAAYECAAELRLRGELRGQLESLQAQLVVPDGSSAG